MSKVLESLSPSRCRGCVKASSHDRGGASSEPSMGSETAETHAPSVAIAVTTAEAICSRCLPCRVLPPIAPATPAVSIAMPRSRHPARCTCTRRRERSNPCELGATGPGCTLRDAHGTRAAISSKMAGATAGSNGRRKEAPMLRNVVFAGLVVAALLPASPARAGRYYGFAVGVANAPPPPVIRLAHEPHLVLSGDAMVYVADDEALRFDGDLFRYGQYWFAYTRGYWYRARAHSGPYTVIDVRKVPRAIIGVPRRMWKHHPLTVAPGHLNTASAGAKAQPVKPRGTKTASRATAQAALEMPDRPQGSAR